MDKSNKDTDTNFGESEKITLEELIENFEELIQTWKN